MKKTTKRTTSTKSTTKRDSDKRLEPKKLAAVTGGWGCYGGSGI